jgi:hypothetical protein
MALPPQAFWWMKPDVYNPPLEHTSDEHIVKA